MSDDWRKDGKESGSSWSQQEEDTWREASAWEEQRNQSESSESTWDEQSGTDTIYSWVNPKLKEKKEEKEWDDGEKRYASYEFSQPQEETASAPKKKSRGLLKKFGLCAALAVVFGVISGVIILGITSLGGGEEPAQQAQIQETVPAAEPVQSSNEESVSSGNTVADVAANSMPSVVAISNVGIQEIQNFFGGTQEYQSESSGSGIIVGQNETELLVATNNHVVTGADTITVSFIDETSAEAQIKGTDANNDLAVVAVSLSDLSSDTLSAIKVATLGNSDDLVVGEQVVAIGNALGYGQSVTSGYVSALNREVTVDNVTAELIQTDAAINPGNSGGALLNMNGELIGINAVKFASSEVEGMGYAIPVSTAEPILDDLMSRETRQKVDESQAAYLGITCTNVTTETQQMYNLPAGVFVDTVNEGSAAEKAGMIKGDIITEFDGTTIASYDELVNTLEYYAAGEEVDLIVMRAESGEYKEVELHLTLDARPADMN
ncbi:MAG: S1C family serine protease [Ruminococcus sp.]|jgi:serine protease Do